MTESCTLASIRAEAVGLSDSGAIAEAIRQTAAEVVLPRWRALRPDQIREKGPNNLVTVADTECEALLGERLTALLPGSLVVGEEAVEADRSLLRRLAGETPAWVIDPVDGTANFATGNPNFCVLVALVASGRLAAGWLYQPVTEDMVVAVSGRGVMVNGKPTELGGERHRSVPDSIGAAYGKLANGKLAKKEFQASGRIGGIANRYAGGVDYIRILKGELDFFYSTGALAWDHAAGMLAVAEAGGAARQLSGDPYSVLIPPGTHLLAAAGDDVWSLIKDLAEGGAAKPKQGWLW